MCKYCEHFLSYVSHWMKMYHHQLCFFYDRVWHDMDICLELGNICRCLLRETRSKCLVSFGFIVETVRDFICSANSWARVLNIYRSFLQIYSALFKWYLLSIFSMQWYHLVLSFTTFHTIYCFIKITFTFDSAWWNEVDMMKCTV